MFIFVNQRCNQVFSSGRGNSGELAQHTSGGDTNTCIIGV